MLLLPMGIIITILVIVSLHPSITGYSVISEENGSSITVPPVLPSSTVHRILSLTMDTDTLVSVEALVTGEAGAWIAFSQDEFIFFPGKETWIPYYITVPEDTPEGIYQAKIVLMSNGEQEGIFDSQVLYSVPITITVSSEVIEDGFNAQEFTVYSSEEGGDILFSTTLENLGNTPQSPVIMVSISDTSGKVVLEKQFSSSFIGYQVKQLLSLFPEPLAEGAYVATLTIDGKEETDAFDVVAEGTLQRKGEITFAAVTVDDDKTVTFDAYVTNTGESVLPIELFGTVVKEETDVDTFALEPQIVLPGDSVHLQSTLSFPVTGAYLATLDLVSGNSVLDSEGYAFYSSNAIGFETNAFIVLGIVLVLLIITHFILTKRIKE